MIKTLFTLFFSGAFAATVNGQCTINTGVFTGFHMYGTDPIPSVFNGSAMATANELQVYDFTLQIRIQPDTATSLGTFPITQMVIDSIQGFPDGISYSINPSSTMPGGAYGCIRVSGTPTAGTALGGPNNDGIYPIIAYTTATVTVFTVPTAFPYTDTNYQIRVLDPTAGLLEISNSKEFKIVYDAANANTYLQSFLKEDTPAQLIDLNGNTVQYLIIHEGLNILEIAQLPTGMYLIQSGNKRARLAKL